MQINDNSKPIPRGQIKRFIERFKLLMTTDHTVVNICRHKRISPKTYYRRLDDYSLDGLPGLLDKPRKSSPKEILTSKIRSITLSAPKLGCRKILDQLRCEGIKRCFKTINNILRKEGLATEDERIRYCDMRDREAEMYQ